MTQDTGKVAYRCPDCGRTDRLEVAATIWVLLDQSDPDNIETLESPKSDGHEWTEGSAASCLECKWVGWVDDLQDSKVAETVRPCGELLYETGVLVARCIQPWGTEHSHHDLSASEAVTGGQAERLHPYEAEGERHLLSGGTLFAGTFDHETAQPRDQGFVDGFSQKQGRRGPGGGEASYP